MAATVQIQCEVGASGSTTSSDITSTNLRLNTADTISTDDTTNAVKIPSSGNNYSFWKHTKFVWTGGTATLLDNFKWYTDGTNSLGTGIALLVATCDATADYIQATGTAGETGDDMETSHTNLDQTPVGAFVYDSGSPLSLTGSLSSTGTFAKYVVLQLQIDNTASSGETTTEAMIWQWDEV